MYKVRVPVYGGRCIKLSEREVRMYPRDIEICESLLMLAERLDSNIRHEELEHDHNVYVNVYIVDIGARETVRG